ncbi:phospholipase D-like domain-containing protein [Aurantimonas sp. A2-1-M11]|uniref:phospholipase D-like domain-containing protein n=1 Tax=Aurantimonas sp. A2-1-M11 TaxID=3113712 RepID=UPI002F937252
MDEMSGNGLRAYGTGAATGRWDPEDRSDWQIFHANRTIWEAVLSLCDGARTSLAIEQYIFGADIIGTQLMDVLTAGARRGVHVRLLVDAYGSADLVRSAQVETFRRAGGELVRYNPASRLLRNPISGMHRLHRKSVIADSCRMMAGGACYTDRMSDWRDTMVRIEGPIVPHALAAFETAWAYAEGLSAQRSRSHAAEAACGAGFWNYLTSDPVRPARQEIYQTLLTRLDNAHRSIDLATPYLFPDFKIWAALTGAVERGVRVRLLMPARSDHTSIDLVSQRFARALARRGVEAYGYLPAMMHAKLAIIDEWSMVSSFNLDILSIGLNVENGLGTTSPAFREELLGQYECDIATSRRF